MPSDPITAARDLLARFAEQRPLRGGSLIVTIFGDALMPRGGAIALGSLLDLTQPFGLNERLVRTAVSRLAREGTLEAHRAGKLSEYRLSKDGRERFAEATARIYSPPDMPWSERWTVIVIPPMPAPERKTLTEELVWRGFGELSATVFAHPELRSQELRLQGAARRSLAKAIVFDASLGGDDAPQRLVSLGWDLKELGSRYQRWVKRFERVHAVLEGQPPLDPGACFIIRTLLIHEYRRLHLRDPLLPQRLLGSNWPGAKAATLARDIYALVFAASEVHLSAVASQLQGPLPAPDAAVMLRFGGLAVKSPPPNSRA